MSRVEASANGGCSLNMAHRLLVRLLLVCTILAILDFTKAQNVYLSTDSQENSPPSIHVNSNLVVIPVTVVDRDDRSVIGLNKNSFRLYDEKAEQVITHFWMEDGPIAVGFLFDASSSMARKIRKAREAVSVFLRAASPSDQFLLVEFNDQVDLLLGLTNKAEEIQKQLAFVQPKGRTALLDAIDFSIHEIRHAHSLRKALVIVSDGGDNCSRRTISEVKNLVRESEVQIFALGIFDSGELRAQTLEEQGGPTLLREVAKQSGGQLFEIKDLGELPGVAAKIGNALRTQYMLGYTPAKPQLDGKYHRVSVKVAQPKGFSRLRASWRRGYYAPVE